MDNSDLFICIDHVGLAVADLDEAIKFHTEKFGFRLLHREDKPLWGASRWEFVTVRVPVRASDAVVMKAINAATKKTGATRRSGVATERDSLG